METGTRRSERDSLGTSDWSTLGRSARSVPVAGHLPPPIPGVVSRRDLSKDPSGSPGRPRGSGAHRLVRGIHRRQLRSGQKGGSCVGKTKRGKGTKWMAVVDGNGLPLGITVHSASPAEVKLTEEPLKDIPVNRLPERLIGDKAYDSDPLAEVLLNTYGIELIAPNRRNRKVKTQDGRPLRRYKRRWKVERFFAWLGNFRRLLIRWERHVENYLGFLHLACSIILLRHL